MQNAGHSVNAVSEHDSCTRISDAHPWRELLAKDEAFRSGVQQFQAADFISRQIPRARIDRHAIDIFVLSPGERGVLPVVWSRGYPSADVDISTHPAAPDGLRVLPRGTHATNV